MAGKRNRGPSHSQTSRDPEEVGRRIAEGLAKGNSTSTSPQSLTPEQAARILEDKLQQSVAAGTDGVEETAAIFAEEAMGELAEKDSEAPDDQDVWADRENEEVLSRDELEEMICADGEVNTTEELTTAMHHMIQAVTDLDRRVGSMGDALDMMRELAMEPEEESTPFFTGEHILFGTFEDNGEKITKVNRLPNVFQVSLDAMAANPGDVFHDRPMSVTLLCDYGGWINILSMKGGEPMALVHRDKDTCMVLTNPMEISPSLQVDGEGGVAQVRITFGAWKIAKVALDES